MDSKYLQNGYKIVIKWIQMDTKWVQNEYKIDTKWNTDVNECPKMSYI